MLSKRILGTIEVSKQEKKLALAKKFIIELVRSEKLHKSEVITQTKNEHSSISKKALNTLIKEMLSDNIIKEEDDLDDTRRSFLIPSDFYFDRY